MNLNSFPTQQITDEYCDPNFPPNYHSSSSVSCHDFFSLSREYYDHPRFFHQPDEINNHAYNHGGSSTNKIENDLRLSLWGKEDETSPEKAPNMSMSSKNIKSHADRIALKITPTLSTIDRKPSSVETDQFSSSNNSSPHSPIRVCSDCNTTKTPLWRSGPKGPKSLCNACGIRQRKARRAMAAAAAAAASAVGTNQPTNPKLLHHKVEKTARSGHSLQVKKRSRMTNTGDGGSIPPPGSGKNKKVCFEDMLINLSKKLAVVHRVFPEEEKDAAILLMALSYGLVHG